MFGLKARKSPRNTRCQDLKITTLEEKTSKKEANYDSNISEKVAKVGIETVHTIL